MRLQARDLNRRERRGLPVLLLPECLRNRAFEPLERTARLGGVDSGREQAHVRGARIRGDPRNLRVAVDGDRLKRQRRLAAEQGQQIAVDVDPGLLAEPP